MRFRGMDARRRLATAVATTFAVLAVPAAASASSAVVLVSGFDTSTPFTTSDPSCAGQEGNTWGNANGPAAALKGAGLTVFTAPIAQSGEQVPPPCLGAGQTAPPPADAIDSNGELVANGAALAGFLQFLNTTYGVDSVQLVGHSDGGLWSRSAITQLPDTGGVTVQSLTTLATPHTGSFGADLAEVIQNGQCDLSDEVEQLLCEAALAAVNAAFADVGTTTVRELSSTFLEGWNPQQSIGCQVSVMGGTYVGTDDLPFRYYNPNDGIVGEASALNVDADSITLSDIPAAPFTPIGNKTFPVVHSSVVSFLSPNTMLNQSDISATVLSAVQATATGTPCLAAAPVTATARRGGAAGSTLPTIVRAHAGFRAFEAPVRGRLLAPVRGETVLLLDGARLTCAGARVPSVPMLGSKELALAAPTCDGRMRVKGGKALALRPSPTRSIAVKRRGPSLRVKVRGPRLAQLAGKVQVDGRWRRLPLKRSIEVPPLADISVRVTGRDLGGEDWTATAHVAS